MLPVFPVMLHVFRVMLHVFHTIVNFSENPIVFCSISYCSKL